jgi:hypothetical protein
VATKKLTDDAVAAALRKADGNMAAVGRAFGVARQSVAEYVARRPGLAAVRAECRESMKDAAESSLHRAVRKGEAWAVCFFLKCQAKDRGYVERSETVVIDGNRLVIDEAEESVGGDPHTNGEAPQGAARLPPQ